MHLTGLFFFLVIIAIAFVMAIHCDSQTRVKFMIGYLLGCIATGVCFYAFGG